MDYSEQKIEELVKKSREKSTERNFEQSFDLSVSIKNLDLSHPENRIREEISLPNGTGKSQKVAVFADGELAEKARDAGADEVFTKDELEDLGDDKTRAKKIADEYSSFLAQSDLMPIVGKELGPVLGPRDKMPQPVTPTEDPSDKISSSRDKVRVSVRDNPVANVMVGKESMSDEEIIENTISVLDFIISELPKGPNQISSINLKTTMGKPTSLGGL